MWSPVSVDIARAATHTRLMSRLLQLLQCPRWCYALNYACTQGPHTSLTMKRSPTRTHQPTPQDIHPVSKRCQHAPGLRDRQLCCPRKPQIGNTGVVPSQHAAQGLPMVTSCAASAHGLQQPPTAQKPFHGALAHMTIRSDPQSLKGAPLRHPAARGGRTPKRK